MIAALDLELLGSLDLKVLAVQRSEVGRWWNYRNVVSPFSRLWLILGGQASVSHHGRQFLLKPGLLHLVPPFTIHDCSCAGRLDHFYLHFASRLHTGLDLLSLFDCRFHIPAGSDALLRFQRLESLYPDRKLPCYDPSREEYRRSSAIAEQTELEIPVVDWFEARAILSLLLVPFLRSARTQEGIHTRATRQFLAVQEFIHEHMSEPILLADLARVAQLHPTYFSDRFKELVGLRPLEYLLRRRIERAQYLLLTNDVSIKQVAHQVGLPDPAYFARAFKRFCGLSPSEYRLSHLP